MKTIGNIFWLLISGLAGAIGYVLEGVVWCITIIGIPFGLQCFKLAKLMLFPFGKTIVKDKGHPIANFIWFIFGGFAFWIGYMLVGVVWCITIIGIPFGKQCFKLAKLSAVPFGKVVSE